MQVVEGGNHCLEEGDRRRLSNSNDSLSAAV